MTLCIIDLQQGPEKFRLAQAATLECAFRKLQKAYQERIGCADEISVTLIIVSGDEKITYEGVDMCNALDLVALEYQERGES